MWEEAKRLLTKAHLGISQWRGSKIPVALVNKNWSDGSKCAYGVTASGGEFTPGGTYPGNYGYPIKETIDYYASIGMKIIRFPFLWERVQPEPMKDFNEVEMALIDPMIDYIISKGLVVGIDPHNGGKGYGHIIGNKGCPDIWFADLWNKLANRYKHYGDKVIFMIMSEPSEQCEYQWLKSTNAAVSAIRSTGAVQTVVVPGTHFDGGWLWTITCNAQVMSKVKDPLNNYMFEVHQYLDENGSGGSTGIVRKTIGADRLHQVTLWARKNGYKMFLGEFGTSYDETSLEALDWMLRYIELNSDVWKYACWWGAGDRWMNYFMSIEPVDYNNPEDAPQATLIRKAINGEYTL